jgi:hypothetical protein
LLAFQKALAEDLGGETLQPPFRTLSSFPRLSYAESGDLDLLVIPLATGEMIDTSPPMIVPCLLDPFAFGDVVPPEIFSGSEPLVNSLRVPFSSKAPKKQPLDSTSVVYRGPPMIGPFG